MGNRIQHAQEFRLNRWHRLYRDLQSLPPRQAGKLLVRKACKGLRARQAESSARRQIAAIEADLGSVLCIGCGLFSFLDSKFASLDGFPVLPEQTRQVTELLHQQFPHWVARCIDTANKICENRLSLLGHEIRLEKRPAWRKDHISGAVWPAEHSAKLRKLRMNLGCDIKFVWELSRFHHGVTLARAFALTADERFARKFVSLFYDWLKANPVYIGPNWTCAMEVAIRAVNLLWAGSLMASSKAFDNAARETFVKALLIHGTFLYYNLEYDERVVGHSLQPVNGNHYLADLAGLLYVSCAFPKYRFASEWREFAQNELFREIRSQVDEEGVHCEYSPAYHRLVVEMVLGCLILLKRQGVAIPGDVQAKTLKMVDFIRHYRKPGGGVPLVRDIDSGRFCILGDEELTSHDHILALGAIFFEKPELYPGTLYEDCLWHLGSSAYEWHKFNVAHAGSAPGERPESRRLPPVLNLQLPGSRLYRQSGFGLLRDDSHYLLAICCAKGAHGYAGHTHNDFLSFELEAYGRTFLTDCGSYVYTQDPQWRNRFRSTLSHNTVVVDGQEQNEFHPTELFEIEARVRPELRQWTSNREQDVLDAAYTLTLPDGTKVTHGRRFVFLKDRGLWLIRDRIMGPGTHNIETRFHFAAGIDIAADPVPHPTPNTQHPTIYRTLCTPGPNLFLIVRGETPVLGNIESGWVSHTYAAKQPITVLRFVASVPLPFERWYILVPTENDALYEESPVSDWENLRRIASEAHD